MRKPGYPVIVLIEAFRDGFPVRPYGWFLMTVEILGARAGVFHLQRSAELRTKVIAHTQQKMLLLLISRLEKFTYRR
ncbi:MAG: hypothetical protein ABSC47_00790 [Terracidiphilus sp.]